ncbi:hypothetical protein FSP39_004402 [Pinctada imbricata]|uniref:Uncharacterized protein n=1 Tax=Pinctada imbricata TaxID=66713 RepID=A0AA89C325_PINIB|nr:hypothetical protein FSP39_004402 [Pinctada imbricata]
MQAEGACSSWAPGLTPMSGVRFFSCGGDYQKMLQNNPALSSGWGSRESNRYDTVGSYSRSKSPLSNTSRPMLGSGLPYPDTRSTYQAYRPSKYSLTTTPYDQTYLNRDFNELSVDDSHTNNDQNVDRADNSVRNVFDYDKYTKNGDIYGRGGKYGSYLGQRSSSDKIAGNYDGIASSDNLWASPPKRASPLDLPSSVFKPHSRSQSELNDPYTKNFSADKVVKPQISGTNAFEDKYFSDNDIVTRGHKSRTSSNVYGGSSGMRQWQREQYPTLSQDKYSKVVNGGYSSTFKSSGDPDEQRWGTLSHSADDAIREKDQIIDKLKMKVMQLEEDNKKFEVKLKHAVMNGEGDGETYKQVQELEYKNAELKSELADLRSKKQSEMENLEIKLGATEEEVNQLRSALRKMAPGSDEIQSQFYQLEQEREEWKQKFVEMREDNTQMKGKLDELQNYLSDLPTLEETVNNNKQISFIVLRWSQRLK